MNSRDSVLAVLENKLSDRVPVMECAIDQKVINSICPGMSCEDLVDYAELDAVMCHTMTEDTDGVDWVYKEKRIWKDEWGALQQNTGEVISIVVPPARIATEADLNNYDPPDPSQAGVIKHAKHLVKRFKGKKAIVAVGEVSFAPSQYPRGGLENLMIDH